ncbi:unnamed protein product [Vicia faba]|uniref:Uncharacterized protein n=1 Tax=Vicia faba TaxID=3906 RepID=A0AAV1AUA6_VICFA|nr:unnamed protein product [Vicia faba]
MLLSMGKIDEDVSRESLEKSSNTFGEFSLEWFDEDDNVLCRGIMVRNEYCGIEIMKPSCSEVCRAMEYEGLAETVVECVADKIVLNGCL